jgi:hypothetical protein
MQYQIRVPYAQEGLEGDSLDDAVQKAVALANGAAPGQKERDPKSPGVPWAVTEQVNGRCVVRKRGVVVAK